MTSKGAEETAQQRKARLNALPMAERDAMFAERNRTRAARAARQQARNRSLLGEGIDNLVVVTPHDPWPILSALWPLLRPSCPFAVFFPSLEPLSEAKVELLNRGQATWVTLTETWSRAYQVKGGVM